MRLDTESLRTLKLAVELGSLTAAAGQLNMSLSAVSWKLKRLETKLGRKLIHRNGHTIEATADAQQLLGYADIIISAHDKAIQSFRLSDVQGRLIIGITDDLAANQLPEFVREFHRGHPGIQLEIKVEQQLTLLEWFDERTIDIAVLPLEETQVLETDTVLWEDDHYTQVWIAAGIGITPFIAWAQTLDNSQTAPIRLYYCVASKDKALYHEELEAIAAAVTNFEVTLVVSGVDQRLSAARIKQNSSGDVSSLAAYFCGPKAMRDGLKSDLQAMGLKSGAFHYEEFEIRSGVGIRKAASWLLNRYGEQALNKVFAK